MLHLAELQKEYLLILLCKSGGRLLRSREISSSWVATTPSCNKEVSCPPLSMPSSSEISSLGVGITMCTGRIWKRTLGDSLPSSAEMARDDCPWKSTLLTLVMGAGAESGFFAAAASSFSSPSTSSDKGERTGRFRRRRTQSIADEYVGRRVRAGLSNSRVRRTGRGGRRKGSIRLCRARVRDAAQKACERARSDGSEKGGCAG